MTIPNCYDESQIESFLDGLSRKKRTLFAVGCAEWLFASYEEFVTRMSSGDSSELRRTLDVAWGLASGHEFSLEIIGQARQLAESLVPSDDSDAWNLLSPIAQNAAAGAAYALRAWLLDSSQEAVWSCRQLYEAADYIVQLRSSSDSYSADEEGVVVIAVQGILRLLELASLSDSDLARSNAVAGGSGMRDHWSGSI